MALRLGIRDRSTAYENYLVNRGASQIKLNMTNKSSICLAKEKRVITTDLSDNDSLSQVWTDLSFCGAITNLSICSEFAVRQILRIEVSKN